VIEMCLAAPAKVLSIAGNEAVVDYNGVQTTARLDALSEPLAPGDYVLIHTGFAIRRLAPDDGEETLRLFDELADSLDLQDAASSDRQAELRTTQDALRSHEGRPQPPSEPATGESVS
jgi:hydrogenase expression/formation protein HypC